MKEDSVSEPNVYLAVKLRRWTVQFLSGKSVQLYAMGSTTYTRKSIRLVEKIMNQITQTTPTPSVRKEVQPSSR